MSTAITYVLRAFSTFWPSQKPLAFSGVGSSQQLADLIIASGQSRPLLLTGGFLLKNGKLDELLNHFKVNGCEVTIYDGVTPNPTYKDVEAGLALSKEHNCDSVIAIGGGSIIDVAKVIAAASTNNRSLEKLAGILKVKKPPLPFYVAPTTSGTGSEATNTAVISEPETHKKKFFVDPKYIPLAVALDPELLKSLPPHMTAAVGMDTLTHAIEAYTSRNNFTDTDREAATAIKLLFDFLPLAYTDGNNLKAREMVAQAALLAGHAFTKASLGYVHAISHQVSAHYDTPHGLTNAVILPRVLRFNQTVCAQRFAQLETMLSGQQSTADTQILADKFIARVDQLAKEIGIPSSLTELKEKDFDKITSDALKEARQTYAVPKRMKRSDIKSILQSIVDGHCDLSFAQ
ncbi:iron-containing alcohol dehydrogenase [bacterium SCSIO 12696]|nr:iron-containing alcohol dehydrogenase [bacterium SCSIO 12696]